MARVAELGCIACQLLGYGQTPAQVHHIRDGQGMQQRAGNYLVLPLCLEHHTGKHGIHGDRAVLRQLNMGELEMLDEVLARLYGH